MNNFLLTYDCMEDRATDNIIVSKYRWFESEEELKDFVGTMRKQDTTFSVNEAIEIISDRKINF